MQALHTKVDEASVLYGPPHLHPPQTALHISSRELISQQNTVASVLKSTEVNFLTDSSKHLQHV